jgi:hypothetical protein
MRPTHVDARSERGLALIIVLLLMAVLSGLATGFAMNGRVEASMALNETYYAGTRAAAEAGINRATAAIRLVTTLHLLKGQDGVEGTADDGDIGFLLTGTPPYALGDPTGSYSYTIEIVDDDDPNVFPGLSADQLDAMCVDVPVPCAEDGTGATDTNNRLVLRATGFGPSNTRVTVSRMLLPTIEPIPGSMVNPAILVDGDVAVDGNIGLLSTNGNGSIHSNGDMTISGNSATIQGDATASGDLTITSNNLEIEGEMGGGYASVNVPTKRASDYMTIADFKLGSDGAVVNAVTNAILCAAPCLTGWGGWTSTAPVLGGEREWRIAGNTVSEGSFYVEGKVSISGSPKGAGNAALNVSLITTSSISVTGNPKFKPDASGNPEKVLFVTDGDLQLQGTGLYDYTDVEGQIFVAEQIHTQGSWQFRGRIIVQNDTNIHDEVTENSIGGTPDVTYNGTLPGYEIPPTVDYTYNITGWIEQ